MSSVQYLRALINERLTAAAEEIFTEFEKTIVQYEEEIDRQRRLLDITWKPQLTLQTTDLPQQHVYEDNVLCEQNLCDQGRNSSLDQQNPEPPQIKDEQMELCTSLEGEQIVLMPEVDMLVQCKSKCDQVSGEIFQYNEEIDRQRRLLDIIWKPQVTLHRIDFPQQHVCIEEKGLNDQQLCNQKRNFTLDQEDPEPSQIKEEQEELCTSLERKDQEPPQIKAEQEELCTSLFQKDPEPPQIKEEQQELYISQQGERVILKQAIDTFLLTSTNEDSYHTELEPNSDQLLSYNLSVADSPHQEGSKHVDSGSSTNEELKPKNSHNRNSSHSTNVDNSSLSESHCDIDTDTKSVKCDVCGKTFKTKNQMRKHRLIHDDVKPHACNACGKTFSFNSQLKAHMIIHKGEKGFCCKTCGKHFSHSGSLTVHMRTHTGNKPYFCEMCGKRFHQSYNLTIHMRTHTSEKPYFCETCGKRFSRSDNLAVHMRTHTSEKPYFCETCGKSFSQSYNLTVHMRTHTSEKPYFCETCGKGFNQRNNLNIHMRTHRSEKPYSCKKAISCKTCGKSFTRGSTLTVHMRTHTGEKPYFCETCGKSFIQRSHLTIHMRTHTGEKLQS